MISAKDFSTIKTKEDLMALLQAEDPLVKKVHKNLAYENELKILQTELVKLQKWITSTNQRVAIICEGRDAAGKGGAIRRYIEHLNPRSMRVVALSKPTEIEKGQWYFRRYIKELPNPGEIVFFDRSWYNRAVVEPVMGFCNPTQYDRFMQQAPEFEHMLYEDGIKIIKFWFSISKDEQNKRFNSRLENPLKKWKFSPVDQLGQEKWDDYTHYKEQMFANTHNAFSPWIIVKTNNKKQARLESIRYILSQFDYEGKEEATTNLLPDPDIIQRYHRQATQLDH